MPLTDTVAPGVPPAPPVPLTLESSLQPAIANALPSSAKEIHFESNVIMPILQALPSSKFRAQGPEVNRI